LESEKNECYCRLDESEDSTLSTELEKINKQLEKIKGKIKKIYRKNRGKDLQIDTFKLKLDYALGIKIKPKKVKEGHKALMQYLDYEIEINKKRVNGLKVKEFRNIIFKHIKLPRSGKFYYLTEVSFPELSKSRIDGLIIVIKSGKLSNAVIFEMKKESNQIEKKQLEEYLSLAQKLRIPNVVTVSNEYVSEPTESPIDIRVSKKINLVHFSWTYLLTIGRILLFKNENNIEDEDQVEIMREVLFYFESEKSGVKGFNKMSPEWKTLTENILAHKVIRENDKILHSAIFSWYQEEKDMALKLSRELGVLVKGKSRNKESIKNDIKYVIKNKSIKTKISVKDAVSDILIEADFEKKNLKMLVNITCPETGTNTSKINWLIKQLENGKKKSLEAFNQLYKSTYVTASIKYARSGRTVELKNYGNLKQLSKQEEINGFKLYTVQNLGSKFTSQKGFIKSIEDFLLNFYDAYVQYLSNWSKPAPKIEPSKSTHNEELADQKTEIVPIENTV